MSDETETTETTEVTIKDLKPYQNRFNVTFAIVSVGEERTVSNRNNPDETHRISDITVADQTGSIILTAWDDDIDLLEEGKSFALNNGFVNIFRDSMRLARGKFGNFTESEATIEANTESNRSDEVHERRQRRSYNPDRGGGGGYGSDSRNRDRDRGGFNSRRW